MKIYEFVFDINLQKVILKKTKNMLNKCYSSMISVQNELKNPIKRVFFIKKKCVDNIDLFKQIRSIN